MRFINKIKEKIFLRKAKRFLRYFGVNYSGDIIYLTDGGNSVIFNNKGNHFSKKFIGYSINSVAEYVAEKLNKKTVWRE